MNKFYYSCGAELWIEGVRDAGNVPDSFNLVIVTHNWPVFSLQST